MLFLSLGAILYQLSQPSIIPSFTAYYNNLPTQTLIEGVFTEPHDVRETYTNLRMRAEQVQPADQSNFIK